MKTIKIIKMLKKINFQFSNRNMNFQFHYLMKMKN